MKIIKIWLHCLIYIHRLGSYQMPKKPDHYFCWDCDYGNDDHSRVIKGIWEGKYV